ncbi:hypothetical protein N8642_04410 [bacterium]|jgi:hypothetical protein|nr:hypothetical protein [bacterium]MDB4746143.1 hypothetical protein [Verrucomicrobiota bacterium]
MKTLKRGKRPAWAFSRREAEAQRSGILRHSINELKPAVDIRIESCLRKARPAAINAVSPIGDGALSVLSEILELSSETKVHEDV